MASASAARTRPGSIARPPCTYGSGIAPWLGCGKHGKACQHRSNEPEQPSGGADEPAYFTGVGSQRLVEVAVVRKMQVEEHRAPTMFDKHGQGATGTPCPVQFAEHAGRDPQPQ